MSDILILENAANFSKRDHKWWTLFGDETFAYDRQTLEPIGGYTDSYFPKGMGSIEGWALSGDEFSWRQYPQYHYILAECEEYKEYSDEGISQDMAPIITVNRAIWLPINYWLGRDCTLRDSPPIGQDKERLIRTLRGML